MTEPTEYQPEADAPQSRTPTLLRFIAHATRDSGGQDAALSDAAGDLDARGRVMSQLITKYLKLDDLAGTLQGVLSTTTNPQTYDQVALQKAEVLGEQSLCKARYDAIDAGQPFSDPGAAAENALLAAIRQVDQATANTAAVTALLGAAHALVQAYAAKSTK